MSDHGRAAEATVVWWIQPSKDPDVPARPYLRQPGAVRRVLWRCLETGDSGHISITTAGHWIDQADVTARVAQATARCAPATIHHVDVLAHLLDPATRLAVAGHPMLPRDLAGRYGLDVLAGIAIDEGTPSRRHVIVERCLPPAMHPRLAQWACDAIAAFDQQDHPGRLADRWTRPTPTRWQLLARRRQSPPVDTT